MKTCINFIAECFALRTAAHYAHLLAKSQAVHDQMGDFYETLTDLADRYAEVYMGLSKQPVSLPDTPTPTGEPIALLESFLERVRDEQDEDYGSQALSNILAEIEELLARTLYKLKNLK